MFWRFGDFSYLCSIIPSCFNVTRKGLSKLQGLAYTHNLTRLSEGSGIDSEMNEEQIDLIETLIPMNIQARYPEYKEQLARLLTKETCWQIINDTELLQQWIKNKLSTSSGNTKK